MHSFPKLHEVSNGTKIIQGCFPNRHTPWPSTKTANVGSGGWSLPSRREELLCLNMHGELARICKAYKVHEIRFSYPHVRISNHNLYKMNPGTGSAHIAPRSSFLSAACNLLSTYLSPLQSTYMVQKCRLLTVLDMKSPSFCTSPTFHKIAFLKDIFNAVFLRMKRMGTSHLLSFSIFTFISWPDLGKVETLSVPIALRMRGKIYFPPT